MQTYWHKQGSEPLFPDLLWSKPENKHQAGKLLIVGGHAHGFAAPAEAYTAAQSAGVGSARILLPDHIRPQLMKFQGPTLEMEFAPSTPSGSFGSKAYAELIDVSNWADSVLLAGDLGRNSETAVVLEKFVSKTKFPITITKDAIDYFTSTPAPLLARGNCCIVLSLAQLQKLTTNAKFPTAITYGMDLLRLVEALHDFSQQYQINIITKHHDSIVVAAGGQVSTTKIELDLEDAWRVSTAAKASVWWLHNPAKPFEALTSAVAR